jgi:hypothetical protein
VAFYTFSASVNFKKRKSEKISDFLKAKNTMQNVAFQ